MGGLGHPKAPTEPSLVHLAEPAMLISDPLLPILAHSPPPSRPTPGPSDPPVKGLQYQTLCAGEIEALLAGQRGVVMVQLWVGWDTPKHPQNQV